MKKENPHKILKKHSLRPVEIVKSKKKEDNNEKKAEKESLEDLASSEKISVFHETILDEPEEFPSPVIKEIEPENEEKNTLEETAQKVETPLQANQDNNTPSNNLAGNYATGLTSSTYTGIQAQQSGSQSYQANSGGNASALLDRDNLNRRPSPVLGISNQDTTSENNFQSMQERYKAEREKEATSLPFEERKRRHGIW